MIHVKYKIRTSSIHGVGLFAGQEIKKGELIYTPSPLLDVNLTQEQFDSLSVFEQQEVTYYGYFHNKTQKYHVAFDAIRILNHAYPGVANVTQDEDMVMVSLRDISSGEELLQDYREIFPDGNDHFKRIYSF